MPCFLFSSLFFLSLFHNSSHIKFTPIFSLCLVQKSSAQWCISVFTEQISVCVYNKFSFFLLWGRGKRLPMSHQDFSLHASYCVMVVYTRQIFTRLTLFVRNIFRVLLCLGKLYDLVETKFRCDVEQAIIYLLLCIDFHALFHFSSWYLVDLHPHLTVLLISGEPLQVSVRTCVLENKNGLTL